MSSEPRPHGGKPEEELVVDDDPVLELNCATITASQLNGLVLQAIQLERRERNRD